MVVSFIRTDYPLFLSELLMNNRPGFSLHFCEPKPNISSKWSHKSEWEILFFFLWLSVKLTHSSIFQMKAIFVSPSCLKKKKQICNLPFRFEQYREKQHFILDKSYRF